MELLPLIFQEFSSNRPSDMFAPIAVPCQFSRLIIPAAVHYRLWRTRDSQKDVGSEELLDKNDFQINIDVAHFNAEEITVKVTGDDMITVEAKHEEEQDTHGYISRHFVRKYMLPKGHDIENIKSKLSSDGILTILAPKITPTGINHRTISIQTTEVPTERVEVQNKKMENTEITT